MLDSQGLTIQNLMNQQMQNNYADNWRQRVNSEVTPNDSTVMARMRQSLIDRGVDNRAHQDAIIANMMVESSGNPNAKNPNSSARGLMQWLTGRQPKAWDWDSQVDHIVNTYNKFGGDNWLDRKAYDRFMNTTDSAEAARLLRQYWERPEKHTYNFTDKYINQMYSKKAFGGELGTNGTDFTNGLLEVNAGSTHEANPFQGVQLGVDAEGTPNLVEEGETIFNDYVFSNRLKVPAFMKKELGLGGKMDKDLTFADASKEIAEESVERPNDPISMNGLRAGLSKLAQIQETERMRLQAEEDNAAMEQGLMAYGGEKGNLFAGEGNRPNIIRSRGINGEYLGDWSDAPVFHTPGLIEAAQLAEEQYHIDTRAKALMKKGKSREAAYKQATEERANLSTGIAPTAGRGRMTYKHSTPRGIYARNKAAYTQAR